ncbi:hypothetical protein HNQ56_000035 [Anaerotaenia torta]|uniref:hypothetical protein n=1 Tax=Anaerotaenia torta TaxID=433293 RepID=UPI003D1BA78B
MNLPFSLPSPKDAGGKKREELQEVTAAYERRLAEYQDTLEIYKKWLSEYSGSKAGTRTASEQSPMNIQAALDLTYLKEQGEKEIELMNELSKDAVGKVLSELELIKVNQVYAGEQLEGLDRNVVNRISELLIELQKQSHTQSQAELTGQVERLEGKLRKNQTLLWFLFVFNLISVSGIAFLILYILELLPY